MKPPRLRPRSGWLYLPATMAIGVVCDLLCTLRFGPHWPVIGLAIGAFVGLCFSLLFSSRDARVREVQQQRPNALVVQARCDSPGARAQLTAIAAAHGASGDLGTAFVVSFDSEGIGLWSAQRHSPGPALVAWNEIGDLDIGEWHAVFVPYSYAYQQMLVPVRLHDGIVAVQFGVENRHRGFMNSAQLRFLIAAIDDLRDRVYRQPRETAARSPLVAGPTAWTAQSSGRLFAVLGFALGALCCGLAAALAAAISPALAVLGVAALVGGAIPVFYARAVVARELRAGYTTLNGTHLDVPQRHPRTGAVIRPAGAPALTADELREIFTAR